MADNVIFWIVLGVGFLAILAVGLTILLLTELLTINENIKKFIVCLSKNPQDESENKKPQPNDCGIDDIMDNPF